MKKLLAMTLVLCCCLTGVAMADTYGLGVYTEINKAQNAYVEDGDKYDGKFEVDSTVCAVVLDDNGVIVDVWFDVAQTNLGFTTEGVVNNEAGTIVPSKFEKQDAYGMAKVAAAGEWYQQARALEQFCVGKTVAEVLALPLTEKGVAEVEDLKTTCTIKIGTYLKALEMAAANAR